MNKTMLAVLSHRSDGKGKPEVDFVLEKDTDRLAKLLLELGSDMKIVQVWQVDLVTGLKDLIAGDGYQEV